MLNELSISEARQKLDSREISAKDLMQACLDRIDAVDGRVNAFISLDGQDALKQAEEADVLIADGKGGEMPLLGIPVAMKDVIAVKGQPLQCASQILNGFVSPYDATATERLKQAGAVVFGRLNMDEFAMGSSTENSSFGVTRTPWDLDRVAGGSSGGSAAAVAAGECLAALASDTGGSIRQPAAFCGNVGLKPTYGRVSRFGLVAFASSLDQIGPITSNVADAAGLLSVIAGDDPRDSTSIPKPTEDFGANLDVDLKGRKLGLVKEYSGDGLDPEVKAAVEAAVKKYEELGAEIVEVSLPHTEYAVATYYIIANAEASANLARFDGVRYGNRADCSDAVNIYSNTREAGFGDEVKRRIIMGTYVLSSGYYDAYYLRAQKVRNLIRQDFLKAFESVDAILSPTTPTPPFKVGEKADNPLSMYLSDIFTISANLAGVCGVSLPCGFTEQGLPIGLQIQGRPMGEAEILNFAHVYEQATDWHSRRPKL